MNVRVGYSGRIEKPVQSLRRSCRIRLGLSGVAFLAFSAVACAATVDPKWAEADYACRVVFGLPEDPGSCVLVSIPMDPSASGSVNGMGAPIAARAPDGTALPCRVVHSKPDSLAVLVGVGERPRRADHYAVYFRPVAPAGDAPVKPAVSEPDGAALRDPTPIGLDIYPHPGDSAPTSWDKMLYLFRSTPRAQKHLKLESFQPVEVVDKPDDDEKRKRHHRERRICVAGTVFLAPADGPYTFALNCRDAGFLLVDGEIVVAWPGKHEADGWREGKPVTLTAGPHSMEIYNSTQAQMNIRPGWRPPGVAARTAITPIPGDRLLASAEAVGLRVEELGHALHASFTYTIMPSYAFRDVETVFTPVRFVNTTKDWITRNMQCQWRFRDRHSGDAEGETVTHRFTSVGMCKAVLLVRDELGFTGSEEQSIDLRFVQPRQYAISADMVALPALCYPSDPVAPRIRVEGEAPPGETVIVAGEVILRSGRRTSFEKTLRPSKQTVFLPVVREEAGRLREIRWQMTHGGIPLSSGSVTFQSPPFNRLPAGLRGDRLYGAAGAQLVLVPYPAAGSFVQPRREWKPLPGRVLMVDDGLSRSPASAGRKPGDAASELAAALVAALRLEAGIRPGAAGPTPVVSVAAAPEWDEASLQYGPLLKFVEIPGMIRTNADVVVFNMGVEDILRRQDVDAFERQVAALTDVASVSMKLPVVWVTPPPFLPDRRQVRPFAAAIKRAADARRVPVADLYSAFAGDPDPASLFLDSGRLALSARGCRLAAAIIARAIVVQREDLD